MKLKVSEIKPNPDNPRFIKDENFKKLVQSLKDFPEMAEVREVVVNKDHVILGGNMRFKAMQEAGWTEIPVRVVDWSEEKQREFIIKDNVSGGDWDWDTLANEWNAEDLEKWGLETPDNWGETEVEEDEAPEVSSEPAKSILGEVYQLGRHRVMCGDSTVKANVEKLMDGVKADMVFTDPPYGMFHDTAMSARQTKKDNWISTPKNYDKVIGDNDDFTPELISTIFDNFGNVDEVFIWGADYFAELIPERNSGSWTVWDKRAGVEDMKWSTSEFELCWSKSRHHRKTARVTWSGILGTEQEHDHADGRSHPTQKPTKLANWFFNHWGKDRKNIVDIYLGSGSTLIACEQTDRTCYGMELDPKYVDVVRKRYTKFVDIDNWEETWEAKTPKI